VIYTQSIRFDAPEMLSWLTWIGFEQSFPLGGTMPDGLSQGGMWTAG